MIMVQLKEEDRGALGSSLVSPSLPALPLQMVNK